MPSIHLELISSEHTETYLDFPEWYGNDKWLFKNLGVEGNQADNQLTFSFKLIKQDWLKLIIKKYVFQVGCNKSCHFVRQIITIMNSFSEFLSAFSREIKSIHEIDREIVLEYIKFLAKKDYSHTSRQIMLIVLSTFFDKCNELGWMNIKRKLIYPEDIPQRQNKIPRFIPDSVLNQLNEKIQHTDPHVRRMIQVLQETGVRINELLKLSFTCIFQDKDGDYFLKYFQSKMNKDHVIPISNQLSLTIKEQQQAVTNEWGCHDLLFPMPQHIQHQNKIIRKRKTNNRGTQWRRRSLARYLEKFSNENQILGPDGKVWIFKFHSFRHTVATKMINHNVPQHIVQRFLGHESPMMTSRYAHIFDETRKNAFSEFRGKMVNITGAIVTPEQIANDLAQGTNPDDIGARWLKKHILAQALPNGTCALPIISKSCPHANACLTCVNFRTDHRHLDVHKAQLEKAKAIVDQARENGWQRQLEMNLAIQSNLEKIIGSLETTKHGA